MATFRNSVKVFYWLLPLALGLCFAGRISAVDKSYFIGNWMNVDQGTRGLRAIQIGQQNNQMMMRAWGACSPNPCKWGYVNVSLLAPNGSSQDVSAATAVFTTNFNVTRVTMRPSVAGMLELELVSHFTDNSGRSDYILKENFRSVSWDQWDSKTFN